MKQESVLKVSHVYTTDICGGSVYKDNKEPRNGSDSESEADDDATNEPPAKSKYFFLLVCMTDMTHLLTFYVVQLTE